MNIKAKDLANILGISPTTVSMVLNNKNGISSERRKQIIEKIEELNCQYILQKSNIRTNNIGFIIYKRHGDIIEQSPFFPLIIESINYELIKNDYNLIFFRLDRNNIKSQKKRIENSNCHGLIIFAVEAFEDDLEIFESLDKPFCILDNNFMYKSIDTICIDNKMGIYKSIKHLYELGHRKIGYIQSKTKINSFIERFKYYHEIMNEFNLSVFDNDIYTIRYSEIRAYEDMKKLISENPNSCTAMIAENDLLAFASMRAFQDMGINIPNDLSIIGFDDRPICLNSAPKLTSISIPKDIFGPLSVNLILDKIKNANKPPVKINISVDLIVRESTKSIK